VPIADARGAVVGAISVATLSARLQRDRVRTVLAAMQAQVARLSRRLAEVERARARR
jgi:DNA-binding IclR family transcriptional regulator